MCHLSSAQKCYLVATLEHSDKTGPNIVAILCVSFVLSAYSAFMCLTEEPKVAVKAEPTPEPKVTVKHEPTPEPKKRPKPKVSAVKTEAKQEPVVKVNAEPKPEPMKRPKPQVIAAKTEPKQEPVGIAVKTEPKPEPDVEVVEVKDEPKPEPTTRPTPKVIAIKTEPKQEPLGMVHAEAKPEAKKRDSADIAKAEPKPEAKERFACSGSDDPQVRFERRGKGDFAIGKAWVKRTKRSKIDWSEQTTPKSLTLPRRLGGTPTPPFYSPPADVYIEACLKTIGVFR